MSDLKLTNEYTRTREQAKAEIEAAKRRFDLVPAEIQNHGQSVEHHERCTIAAAERSVGSLDGAPMFRATVQKVKPAP